MNWNIRCLSRNLIWLSLSKQNILFVCAAAVIMSLSKTFIYYSPPFVTCMTHAQRWKVWVTANASWVARQTVCVWISKLSVHKYKQILVQVQVHFYSDFFYLHTIVYSFVCFTIKMITIQFMYKIVFFVFICWRYFRLHCWFQIPMFLHNYRKQITTIIAK